jgi:hypothetical protein
VSSARGVFDYVRGHSEVPGRGQGAPMAVLLAVLVLQADSGRA